MQQSGQQWGLTVNTGKTKLLLLLSCTSMHRAALQAGLSFGGQQLEAVTSFKCGGIAFHTAAAWLVQQRQPG